MRPPRGARIAFVVYALALFVATHTPRIEIPGPGRPDLLVHATVFAVWTALFIRCRFFGSLLSVANVAVSALIAAAYSGLDEILQAIPFIHRVAAWDDWAANLIGVAAAGVAAAVIGAARRRTRPAPPRAHP